mgnify:CR=1 FL=1
MEVTGSPVVSVRGAMTRARSGSSQTRPLAVASETTSTEPKPIVPKEVVEKPKPTKPIAEKVETPKPTASAGTGTLLLAAKPPCKIFINGRDTGMMTPQRKIELPVGSHRVTLVNNEHGIKESFPVKIKADAATKSVKNYTSQIK